MASQLYPLGGLFWLVPLQLLAGSCSKPHGLPHGRSNPARSWLPVPHGITISMHVVIGWLWCFGDFHKPARAAMAKVALHFTAS